VNKKVPKSEIIDMKSFLGKVFNFIKSDLFIENKVLIQINF